MRYRLRLLGHGNVSTTEFRSNNDSEARADVRGMLSELQQPSEAELWRVDDDVRTITRLGIVPYALTQRAES